MIQIAIIQFPGMTGEREIAAAIERAGMVPVEFLWSRSPHELSQYAGYVLPGGASYRDLPRPGIIAALHPLISELKIQSEQGKPILGIGNGAQILVESGLVPGVENYKPALGCATNLKCEDSLREPMGFYNAWVHVRLSQNYQRNAFTRHLSPKDILEMSIAHSHGRFVMSSALQEEIVVQGLDVLQYCDATGHLVDNFPVNPNGSLNNIAAVSNKVGNVLAMMPHPELAVSGDVIFQSMRDYIAKGWVQPTLPLCYYPRKNKIPNYAVSSAVHQLLAKEIAVDYAAQNVEDVLRAQGLAVSVQRYLHWEVEHADDAMIAQIKSENKLFDSQHTEWCASNEVVSGSDVYLVRMKNETHSLSDTNLLIRPGEIWSFVCDHNTICNIDDIIAMNIIANPFAQDIMRVR